MCDSARVIDLAGSTVFAGFTDSHQHLAGVGKRTKTLSLFGISTLQETVQTIEDWTANIPEGNWVQGRGWIEREWTDEQRFLNKHDVDPFSADKPLFMLRADGVSADWLIRKRWNSQELTETHQTLRAEDSKENWTGHRPAMCLPMR